MGIRNFFTGKNPGNGDSFIKAPLLGPTGILHLQGVRQLDAPIPMKKAAMMPRLTGDTTSIKVPQSLCTGLKLVWESRETGEAGKPLTCRIPEQAGYSTPISLPFRLGGRWYPAFGALVYRKEPDSSCFVDLYGRKVFHYSERFPCFDSFDYLHDHRQFHWFYLRSGDRLIRIYYADGSHLLDIATDVAAINQHCREGLRAAGFLG